MPTDDEQELINCARIAYAGAGAKETPSNGSYVVEIDGVAHVILRNISGVLAIYRFNGDTVKRLPNWPAPIA